MLTVIVILCAHVLLDTIFSSPVQIKFPSSGCAALPFLGGLGPGRPKGVQPMTRCSWNWGRMVVLKGADYNIKFEQVSPASLHGKSWICSHITNTNLTGLGCFCRRTRSSPWHCVFKTKCRDDNYRQTNLTSFQSARSQDKSSYQQHSSREIVLSEKTYHRSQRKYNFMTTAKMKRAYFNYHNTMPALYLKSRIASHVHSRLSLSLSANGRLLPQRGCLL